MVINSKRISTIIIKIIFTIIALAICLISRQNPLWIIIIKIIIFLFNRIPVIKTIFSRIMVFKIMEWEIFRWIIIRISMLKILEIKLIPCQTLIWWWRKLENFQKKKWKKKWISIKRNCNQSSKNFKNW
jgi:hypothetical protein